MLELDARAFIGTVTEVRRLLTVMDQNLPGSDQPLNAPLRLALAQTTEKMAEQVILIGSQSAWVAANRLNRRLRDTNSDLMVPELKSQLSDVELRFSDHLDYVRFFVAHGDQINLLQPPSFLLGELTAMRFTRTLYDCEEAAKCLCLERPTASVFHSMRMVEIGIRAFAKRLSIEDPIRPAERNWASMLRLIKAKIDADFPLSSRMPHSEGSFLEGLFTTLDAIKNPWRNEVMHVDGVYADAEARFIFMCVIAFLQKMATSFDENGIKLEEPTLLPPRREDRM